MAVFRRRFTRGEVPDRHIAAVAVASELVRLELAESDIKHLLEKWNSKNDASIGSREIDRDIRNAVAHQYSFSCNHPVTKSFCVGHEHCSYLTTAGTSESVPRFRDFIRYRWPTFLTATQTNIYWMTLHELEIIRKVGPGGRLYATHRQIADLSGCWERYIGDHLTALAIVGLISYVPGSTRKWEGLASEIRRISPVPVPNTELKMRLKELKKKTQAKKKK